MVAVPIDIEILILNYVNGHKMQVKKCLLYQITPKRQLPSIISVYQFLQKVVLKLFDCKNDSQGEEHKRLIKLLFENSCPSCFFFFLNRR